MKRTWVGVAALILGGLSAAGALTFHGRAGYPLARLAPEGASPLWRLTTADLDRVTLDDARALGRAAKQLDAAVADAQAKGALLATARIEDLTPDARGAIREVWWSFLEPMVAIDTIKQRHEGWFGVDYVKHPHLHARSFALAFAALCAQVHAGHTLTALVADHPLAQKLFDEGVPDRGLPAGTFRALQARLVRSRDLAIVPAAREWFDLWIDRHLAEGDGAADLRRFVAARAALARAVPHGAHVVRAGEARVDVLKKQAFALWFPVQKGVSEWAGDTRVVPEGRRLVSDAQVAAMKRALRPGDILVERRNWYVSNVGLPGFWPHAALYVGTQDDLRATFDGDAGVRARFGGPLSDRLAAAHPAAWRALGEKDGAGHPRSVIEAVSEGVVASSVEHTCGADYVAALRTTFGPVELAAAIDRALGYFGRPYDFDFDFATDDQVVCSELVLKAYEPPSASAPGLRVPFVTTAGRRTVPPTELVRAFADRRAEPDHPLEFVYFLDGRESSRDAVVADADALAASCRRPKWDFAQP